jgi:pimeloyl-ACP methyl ester carboxylesterase
VSSVGPTAFDSHELLVSGHRIAMRIQGAGDPLLLINGMARPLQSWEPFADELPGRTIVSFDMPGVGASPTPAFPLSIPALAAVAVGVLEAAGFDDADVLGFSHGGAVAQQLAVDAPAMVRRLILVATSCGVGAIPGNPRAAMRSIGKPRAGKAWPYTDGVGMLWHSLAFSSWSSIPFLGGIRARTLVVSGTDDRVVPPANSRVLAGRIPGASLVVVPGGHDLQRHEPAAKLARVVDDFLPAWRGTTTELISG